MLLAPVNTYNNIGKARSVQPAFKHDLSSSNNCSFKDKAIIATTSAIGVATSLAILAKQQHYSLKPSKMFHNIKNSYLAKVDYEAKQVISMGVGTCLGGLAGGYIIDKNPVNRQAKRREAIMQIGNISIPIVTVKYASELGAKIGGKFGQTVGSIAGIFGGVALANFLMNHLSDHIFKEKNDRGIKLVDYSAHVDDMVCAAHYVAPANNLVHLVGRIVPIALCFPGVEVGTKTR